MTEEWRDIKGYEGSYQVSNLGRVRSLDRYIPSRGYYRKGRIIQPFDNKEYNNTNLNLDRKTKTFCTHRLVAEVFIPNPDNKPCINHIDGNKRNNVVSNLEWVTHKENTQHAIKLGLIDVSTSAENGKKSVEVVGIPIICEDSGQVFECIQDAKRVFGSEQFIQESVRSGKRSHGGKGFLFKQITREEYLNNKSNQKSQDEYNQIYESIWAKCKHMGRAVKIHCVEKDKTYESVSSAARDNHMANETIRLSIIENRKAKGLTFMRVDGGEF